jgi:hypothetical protein
MACALEPLGDLDTFSINPPIFPRFIAALAQA